MLRKLTLIFILLNTVLLMADSITRDDAINYYKERSKIFRDQTIYTNDIRDWKNRVYDKNKKYITIHLIGKEVCVEDLKYLKYLPELEIINIKNTRNIKDNDLIYMSDMPKLEHINLVNTGITGEGFKYLNNLPSLKSMELSVTNVTDESIQELKKFKTLKIISVYNTKVTQKGVDMLQKELPGCNIYLEAEGDNNQ